MTSRSIRLIAPSGYCHNQPAAHLGVERLRAAGHQVENTGAIARRFQRFAGTDSERLDDINALADLATLPDIVLAVRGGYGATRLLPSINYAALQRRLADQPLALCGHSDFTVIQLALLQHAGIISFSGPMLAGNFGAAVLSEFTLQHFWQALTSPTVSVNWKSDTPDNGTWHGTLWGGNLAMISSLIGTPWMPAITDGILVIEDVNEHPFRIERMLLQLHQCGILAQQRAIITGSFTSTALSDYDNGFDFATVWQYLRDLSGLPVISDLDFGHGPDTVTLPLGARATLAVHQGQVSLQASGHPVLRT
ncbi:MULTISPECIES: muramoyltetrapeptide carboxypeptidase [Pantoea]|uniref:L,D-carboxypeptidase A n=1 Tax=Pantoea stewartii subsp. stewartii DC283 TaxID=660596 RepID=H3RE52_PANSE|nr:MULTISPECIES: muramoyltetrapeptide carboxypeptidase [Pantoea]ARF49865.1 muramoyltetrapeptide carboxypeptidase [Pantoea stewartii subsp. stewartii DC283]EHU00395.1 L,D-carboxypeptidase A [Pantoea stewartii subsp. stewartii DC283]KAB0546327.1 muramoyltetrapeptide carboxypeptidase [Pantoea stewartii subsp. stewartii]MBC0854463.1 muramoyltetrapeptide carboxypeptidase [Pantoea stewartii]MCU7368883.1 muramoyltetrapeptide carboxypeptidase [Pantoea stewartii]